MASSCNMSYSRNLSVSLRLLTLFLTMTWHLTVTESVSLTQLRGEVGGNVTFHCDVNKKRQPIFWYLQQGDAFINGRHESKNLTSTWNNTRLDPSTTAVHMDSLKVSDAGGYQCFILYEGNKISEQQMQLSITARYSPPVLTVDCRDEISCQATCASDGGYPSTQVTWNVPESHLLKDVNSSERIDPETKLVSITSTAFFNCSNGELMSLSCSVRDVTSEMVSVCEPKDPPKNPNNWYVIAASVIALAVVTIIVVLMLMTWRKKRRGAVAVDVRQEHGSGEETVPLN